MYQVSGLLFTLCAFIRKDKKLCLNFQIENLKANVNYLHENIMECQQNIVQMEQAENPEEEGEEGITKSVELTVLC